MCYFFPEGESPLYAPLKSGEVLASGKVVWGNPCTEGSQTAKSGTDEQEVHKRHGVRGKQAQHCKAQRIQTLTLCRCNRHRMKERALTGGGLGIDSVSMCQEVSRGHISKW